MTLRIKTTATDCHMAVYILSHGHTLLQLTDTDEGEVDLLPGVFYIFRWEVWRPGAATVKIEATLTPANDGFPIKDALEFTYNDAGRDGNDIPFTLQ